VPPAAPASTSTPVFSEEPGGIVPQDPDPAAPLPDAPAQEPAPTAEAQAGPTVAAGAVTNPQPPAAPPGAGNADSAEAIHAPADDTKALVAGQAPETGPGTGVEGEAAAPQGAGVSGLPDAGAENSSRASVSVWLSLAGVALGLVLLFWSRVIWWQRQMQPAATPFQLRFREVAKPDEARALDA
jgi:hypothetical protein